jgi:hypothetical protein
MTSGTQPTHSDHCVHSSKVGTVTLKSFAQATNQSSNNCTLTNDTASHKHMVKLQLTESNVNGPTILRHVSGQPHVPATLSRTLDSPPEMVSMCMWRASHWFGAISPTQTVRPFDFFVWQHNYRSMNPEELKRIPGPNKCNQSGGRGIKLAQRNEDMTKARRERKSEKGLRERPGTLRRETGVQDCGVAPSGLLSACHFCFIHSFSILSDDRSRASSKTIPPHSSI